MAIRAQCDNCGKVYNLPDQSAGKRLRCKQCAVAFTVPMSSGSEMPVAQAAPTVGPQKICVVCGQDVAGRPRTKDQSGNYYCRSCYEEKARAREQLAQSRVGAAVPAGVGGGDGGEGEMIDLSTLEPTEQFDESAQPAPPPIDDLMAPPIPDEAPILAEPVMLEVPPRPKKKKKKKKGAVAKAAAGDSAMDKIKALPIELWIFAVCAVVFCLGLLSSSMAGPASTTLSLVGTACGLWGDIAIIFVAFSEGTVTGLMVLFLPFYGLVFIITHWSEVSRHFGRSMLGLLFIIGGIVITAKQVADHVIGSLNAANSATIAGPQKFSSDPAFNLVVDAEPPGEGQEQQAQEKQIADTILTSFRQRSLRPPQGEKYDVEAKVSEGESATAKVNIPLDEKGKNKVKVRAPMLTCQLVVKNAAGSEVYNQSRPIVMAKDALEKATPEQQDDDDYFLKLLWKDVAAQFKEMAGEVPLPAGGGEKLKGDAASDSAK